jgi:hypothetical protein
MKVQRKPITVQVQVQVHAKLKAIQEETGLSQAKVIEMLVENYNPQVQPKVQVQPQVPPFNEEELLAKVQVIVQAQVDEAIKNLLNNKPTGSSTSNSTIKSTSTSTPEEGEYVSDFVDPDEHMFEYVTDVDADGNERKIRVLKPEYLYGKVEEPENKPYDLNDPIDKMLYEQEQEWKKQYGED